MYFAALQFPLYHSASLISPVTFDGQNLAFKYDHSRQNNHSLKNLFWMTYLKVLKSVPTATFACSSHWSSHFEAKHTLLLFTIFWLILSTA